MLDKKNAILISIFLIFLSVISAIITYKIVIDRSSEKAILTKDSEELKNIEELPIYKTEENNEFQFSINEVFNSVENLYIKNNTKLSKYVKIDGKNKDIVVANIKALQKIKAVEDELVRELLDFDSYDYDIKLNDKNIIIRLYNNAEYMIVSEIKGKEDTRYIYKLDKKELEDFLDGLEDIYLTELVKEVLYPLPEEIYINAKDENTVYVARRREVKNLISRFKILSIEDTENYIGVPTLYPNYNITIKRDDYEYKFYLKNNELMIIDTPILYLYCKYDSELWDFIVDKLPQENNAKEHEFKFLMKSEKVVVKDMQGIYDFENHTYYNIEIPRQIIKSDIKRLGDVTEIIIDEDLRFVLKFYIFNESKDVLIYDNYVIYEESLYYCKNIAETIRSSLMMP